MSVFLISNAMTSRLLCNVILHCLKRRTVNSLCRQAVEGVFVSLLCRLFLQRPPMRDLLLLLMMLLNMLSRPSLTLISPNILVHELLDSVVLLAEIITSLAQLIQSLLQAVTVLLLLLLSYRMLLLQL